MLTPTQTAALEIASLIMKRDSKALATKLAQPEGLSPLLSALAPKSLSAEFSEALQKASGSFYLNAASWRGMDPAEKIAHILMASKDNTKGAERARVGEALLQAGWTPTLINAAPIQQRACMWDESETALWMGERGLLAPQTAEATRVGNLCAVFQNETPRQLEILERLVKAGVVKDAKGHVGFTDFMAHHQFKCAQLLCSLGFAPRTQVVARRFNQAGMSAVASYARLVNEMPYRTPEEQKETIARVKSDLNFLASIRAPFSSQGPGSDDELMDPFASSCFNRSGRNTDIHEALYKELIRHGANVNQSGLWLALEARALWWSDATTDNLELALSLGADPTLNPGPLFNGLSHASDQDLAIKWFDKLCSLGADPRAIPACCPAHDHPLGALRRSIPAHFKYIENALSKGLRADWISSEDGSTTLHPLAASSTKPALEFTRRFLDRPEVKALVNHQKTVSGASGGETALMLAAGELNAEQIKTLLAAGADPNLQDAQGRSCLHHAGRKYGAKAQKKCADIIALLLEGGADPALPNAKGLTAGQAMAKRAPLEGLATLLELRPGDLGGSTPEAKAAQESLMARGGRAVSLAENAALKGELTLSGEVSEPAPKPKRSRL